MKFKPQAILLTIVLLGALAAGIVCCYTMPFFSETSLWDDKIGQIALIGVFALACILGLLRGRLKKQSHIEGDVVIRHGVGSFIEHWYTAWGIFAAFASGILLGFTLGFGLMGPVAQSVETTISSLNFHYFAVCFTVFGGALFTCDYISTGNFRALVPYWHEVTRGFLGKYTLRNYWIEPDKYMASQKAAAVPYYLIGVICFLSGAIKFGAHLISMPVLLDGIATIFHDWFALFIIFYTCVHVMIVVILGHWGEFWSWWTFEVKVKEMKHEFGLWLDKLQGIK